MNNCQNILSYFPIDGTSAKIEPFGNGHINTTFLITTASERSSRYILQKINTDIFQNYIGLMENICGITTFLREKIIKNGGDPMRETLTVINAASGEPYVIDEQGDCWRIFNNIEDSYSLDAANDEETLFKTGAAFGHFMKELSDYPAHTLYETIPNFHNTYLRYKTFLETVSQDKFGRAASVQPEIDFINERAREYNFLVDLLAEGKLPLRVTHNDTKLNNILFDISTGSPLCVVDLDTVMPGLSLYDYGDAIRFAANTAAEDETDLSKVSLNLPFYTAYTNGYLQETADSLTELERKLLPTGAKLITLELGIRFLTDHINGDVYFKIHRENHNLDRARTQLALAADMERKWSLMEKVVNI